MDEKVYKESGRNSDSEGEIMFNPADKLEEDLSDSRGWTTNLNACVTDAAVPHKEKDSHDIYWQPGDSQEFTERRVRGMKSRHAKRNEDRS